jgi:hypothetical protein
LNCRSAFFDKVNHSADLTHDSSLQFYQHHFGVLAKSEDQPATFKKATLFKLPTTRGLDQFAYA